MSSKYSFFVLAAISLTASANELNSLLLPTDIATALSGGGVPSTVIQENSGTKSPNSKGSHGGDYKAANKANPEDPTGFSPTNSGGGGATNISYTFGSPTGSGSIGPKNINIELPFPGANSDSAGGSTASGASRALANATGSAAVGASAVGTGISSSQSGSNVANGAQAVSNGVSNYGAQSAQGANTQSASQNSGSPTPTFETLFKPGTNNLPTVSAPKTPISGSFQTNMENAGVTTNIPSNIGNLVGNSSNLFASILPGDTSSGKNSKKAEDTFTNSVQSAPSTNNYSTPLIIAANSPSQESPVTATNPTSSSPTSTTPSSTSSTPSSTTTAGTSTTSTPASSTSTTSGATPSTTTTSASNSGTTPSASGTPASTTHAGGATAAVAPTTGTPVVTAQNSTTPSATTPTTSGANLSSTGSRGATAAPESQGSSMGGLRLFDPSLPDGIPNGNAFSYQSISREPLANAKLFPNTNTSCTAAKYKQLIEYVLQGNGFAKNPPDKPMSVMGFGDNYDDVVKNCVVPNKELSQEFVNYLDSALKNQCRSLLNNYGVPMVIINPYGDNYIKNYSEYSYMTRIFNSENNKKVYFRCSNIYALKNDYFKDLQRNSEPANEDKQNLTPKNHTKSIDPNALYEIMNAKLNSTKT